MFSLRKRGNPLSFRFCVLRKTGKITFSEYSSSILKHKVVVVKFLGFEECVFESAVCRFQAFHFKSAVITVSKKYFYRAFPRATLLLLGSFKSYPYIWYGNRPWGLPNFLLRWLPRVFLRLSSARYHCLADVSINRACKNDAVNPKKKRKPL